MGNWFEVDLALDHRGRVADQNPKQDRQASEDSLEQHRDQNYRHDRYQRGQFRLFHPVPRRRSQVETDQRNDRARNCRGHHGINPASTREVNNDADQCQGRPRRNDATQGIVGAEG